MEKYWQLQTYHLTVHTSGIFNKFSEIPHMVWYGMVCTTLPEPLVHLVFQHTSYSCCTAGSSEVATPFRASTVATLQKCASRPLGPVLDVKFFGPNGHMPLSNIRTPYPHPFLGLR